MYKDIIWEEEILKRIGNLCPMWTGGFIKCKIGNEIERDREMFLRHSFCFSGTGGDGRRLDEDEEDSHRSSL